MPELQVRWSEHEARKPYARPFGVTFLDDKGDVLGSVALSGADLLYHRQFQAAVLALTGELFHDAPLLSAADPQRAWLDRLAALLPALRDFSVQPQSAFDEHTGRVFRFDVATDGAVRCTVDAACLLEYQEFQATLAHQTGALFRDENIEAIDDPSARLAAWMRVLGQRVHRPERDEAMSASWPWR